MTAAIRSSAGPGSPAAIAGDGASAVTIDDVIERLEQIIAQCRERKSRRAYFAVLYRSVTVRVKEGIERGRFEDRERMADLDVAFANRYLDAYDRYSRGEATSRCWMVAFDGAASWRPIVLQHLLLGMNAHINLDLAIAAARTCPGSSIVDLEHDFREINQVLFELLEDVQDRLNQVSPWGRIVDVAGGRLDELLVRIGLTESRDWAWMSALHLAALDREEQEQVIGRIDRRVAEIGRSLLMPGLWLAAVLLVVRISERSNVEEVIELLGP